ncbi:hypothetical protein GCM10027610_058380 [Dactylosporangium cerinum]
MRVRHVWISSTHLGRAGTWGFTSDAAGCRAVDKVPTRRRSLVADLWFVLLTIAAFAILGLAVRAVERL